MPEITAALVKQLRDATNVSMMECKKALIETNGDTEAATRLLRERGMAVAAKRASKEANEGLMASAFSEDRKTVSLVEVNCETDFVARNETFKRFVDEVAQRALGTDADLAEEMKGDLLSRISEIGENLRIRRHARYVLEKPGILASYIHLGGKVGVLVELGCEKPATSDQDAVRELARDLTLHVAACNPRYLSSDDIPEDVLKTEKEIYAKQVEDKPPQIVEKIVDGKIKKFYAEVCLPDQGFVKEPKQAVRNLLAEAGKKISDVLTIRRFLRYQLGE